MRRNGFFVLCSALFAAGALGGCFDEGVFAVNVGGGSTTQGGGVGGAAGAGGAGGATATASSASGGGGGSCEPCYDGPDTTLRVGLCKSGCRQGETCPDQVVPAVEDCATEDVDESCDGEPGCSGKLAWSTRLGEDEDQYGYAIDLDSAGNTLVAGSFSGSMGFARAAGGTDAFVGKLDPEGMIVWGKGLGSPSTERCNLVARDSSDNVIFAGTFDTTVNFGGPTLTSRGNTDVFVAKLTPKGDLLWAKRIGGTNTESVHGLAVDSEDNLIIAGKFTNMIDVLGETMSSVGGEDVFVVKISAAGGHVWNRRFGDPNNQGANDLALGADDSVVLVGRATGTIDFGEGPVVASGNDGFVAKLDKAGSPLWGKIFGDFQDQDLVGVAVDRGGNILVAGYTSGSVNFGGLNLQSAGGKDAVVAAFKPDGMHAWSDIYGATDDQEALDVATDPAGNVVLAGRFRGAMNVDEISLVSRGWHDAFLAKLDPTGKPLWAKPFGGSMDQSAMAVKVDAVGAIFLTGSFMNSIDLGAGGITSAGGHDVFVAKLLP